MTTTGELAKGNCPEGVQCRMRLVTAVAPFGPLFGRKSQCKGVYRKSNLGEKGTFGATAARKTAGFRGYRLLPVNIWLKGRVPV